MNRRRAQRFCLGPTDIAGWYSGLAAGLTELGHTAHLVSVLPHRYAYAATDRPRIVRWLHDVNARRADASGVRGAGLTALGRLLYAVTVIWAIAAHDVFVFGGRRTLLGGHELALLKALRKRVIVVLHGSDSRPAYLDGGLFARDTADTVGDAAAAVRRQKTELRRLERWADVVVSGPQHSQLHERPVVRFTALGFPLRGVSAAPDAPPAPGVVRIAHSPSDPLGKGSPAIRAAVAEVAADLPVEYVELTGRPHGEVMQLLASSHIAIDQLYNEGPQSTIVAEAALLGRPSIVGGYAGDAFPVMIPAAERVPVAYTHPDDLAATIRRLVTDKAQREDLGRRAQAFVRANWTARAVAERVVRLASGTPPDEWLFDPSSLTYVGGCGLPEERARRLVACVIDAAGREGLQVADKPALEAALVAFARHR